MTESEYIERRIEIKPVKKEKFLYRQYWEICEEEEAAGYGVYYNDDREAAFETVEEAEREAASCPPEKDFAVR